MKSSLPHKQKKSTSSPAAESVVPEKKLSLKQKKKIHPPASKSSCDKQIGGKRRTAYFTSPRELAISRAMHQREIKAICIYPNLSAGKLARHWMETALHSILPHTHVQIEYFSYALLIAEEISWESVSPQSQHHIILIVGDGGQPLEPKFRHSLHELMAHHHGDHSLVLFRDLDPEPSLNTQTIINFLAALAHRHQCELRAMNGHGDPIDCYRHPRLLLQK